MTTVPTMLSDLQSVTVEFMSFHSIFFYVKITPGSFIGGVQSPKSSEVMEDNLDPLLPTISQTDLGPFK